MTCPLKWGIKICIYKQLRHKVTTNTARQLYYAFLYYKIKYGLEVFGNTSSRNISKFWIMRNKLLKYVMKFDIRTATNLLHITLGIMKMRDTHKNNGLTFVNMCLIGKCPEIFNQYHRLKTIPYETRQEGSLYIYAIPQNRLRCSISESSRSQTLDKTGKRPGKIKTQIVP